MTTVAEPQAMDHLRFRAVLQSFLSQPGLPFAQVLEAQDIQQAFAARGGLFAGQDIYSTPMVLWAFLAQVLSDGKGAACAAAVAHIAAYLEQIGRPAPCGDTGDYCRARAKLDPEALRQLVRDSAARLEAAAPDPWLWRGRHAKLIDGFTFTMPDTPANQQAFPQQSSQTPGVGLPIARVCAIVSLATAAICDLAIGPYQGKRTGETALLRQMLDSIHPGDLALFDRYFCSFMMLALLRGRGADVCARLHQRRKSDFRRGQRLGKYDHLVIWTRPKRPDWMSPQEYEQVPQTLTLRELKFSVCVPGRRTQCITVITTLTDPVAYPKQAIAELYGYRWNAEMHQPYCLHCHGVYDSVGRGLGWVRSAA